MNENHSCLLPRLESSLQQFQKFNNSAPYLSAIESKFFLRRVRLVKDTPIYQIILSGRSENVRNYIKRFI